MTSVSCVFFVPLFQVWVPPSLIERLTGDAGLDSPAGQCQVRVPLSLIKRSTGDAEQNSPAGVKSNVSNVFCTAIFDGHPVAAARPSFPVHTDRMRCTICHCTKTNLIEKYLMRNITAFCIKSAHEQSNEPNSMRRILTGLPLGAQLT